PPALPRAPHSSTRRTASPFCLPYSCLISILYSPAAETVNVTGGALWGFPVGSSRTTRSRMALPEGDLIRRLYGGVASSSARKTICTVSPPLIGSTLQIVSISPELSMVRATLCSRRGGYVFLGHPYCRHAGRSARIWRKDRVPGAGHSPAPASTF